MNKITKTNMTKFDYISRKLGFIGIVIIAVALLVGLPLIQTITKSNELLVQEIREVNNVNRELDESKLELDAK